ncbi:MAG: DUF2721 domain-containing protein [Gemmatirosa sp.]|nr:DUF2721 domain-containing protein [Gemmatirosa sp.]
MTGLPDALSVLSAMITPAVLISGCGSLIMATSGRLNRAVDRTRDLFQRFAQIAPTSSGDGSGADALDEERRMLFRQLDFTTTRSRLLQRALSRLYWALGVFVGTSVAIGLVAIAGRTFAWVPIGLGLGGAALLLYACVLLVHESRLALAALDAEMDFVWQQGKRHASPELLDLQMPAGIFARRG